MSDHWIAVSALVISFVAAFFTAMQWASAYSSAKSAARSAKAAETSTSIAEQALVKTQRAWVLVSDVIRLSGIPQNTGGLFDVDVVVNNYGLTPVLEVTIQTSIQLCEEIPEQFAVYQSQPQQGTNLGPGGSSKHMRAVNVSATEMRDITQSTKIIVVMVHISYRHLFSQTSVHTKACLAYDAYSKRFLGTDKHHHVE